MRWLDPASQARLKGLALGMRRPPAAGSAPGRHGSRARGSSRDFSHHRPYAPGDEARDLDWKAYARLDRHFVRAYRAEQRLTVTVLLDASASMGYAGAGRPPKFDTARRAAAALAWLALARGDEAGLLVFGERPLSRLPARAGLGWLTRVDEELERAAPSGGTDLPAALSAAAAAVPRRGLVALVSDLHGEPSAVLSAAAALTARRHELLAVRVLDPDERDIPGEGPAVLEGLEGGEVAVDDGIRAAYREAAARTDEALAAGLRRLGAAYARASTDSPWEEELLRALL